MGQEKFLSFQGCARMRRECTRQGKTKYKNMNKIDYNLRKGNVMTRFVNEHINTYRGVIV